MGDGLECSCLELRSSFDMQYEIFQIRCHCRSWAQGQALARARGPGPGRLFVVPGDPKAAPGSCNVNPMLTRLEATLIQH